MREDMHGLAASTPDNVDAFNEDRTTIPSWVPCLGMTFSSPEEAWNFWLTYGGRIGFDVRKRFENTSKIDGKVTSARFVCSSQGFRGKDKRNYLIKHPRAETRIGCDVRMGLTLKRETGIYEISDLCLQHNHLLQTPETSHLMPSQRKISEAQAFEIEMADKSGIRPKIAHELAGQYVGGTSNLGYTCRDHKNYLRTKRQNELKFGEAGGLLSYFQNKVGDNPSFKYELQFDIEDQITNIFWADAKMIVDYAHFGDVVTFDTTFGTNRDSRPFGVFVGFNHFRETVVFGAALMYDETFESFKWLFETFLSCHGNKQPRTIYTDQDFAMGKAVSEVFSESWHGLCTWHIMQNAAKHLKCLKKDDSNILSQFSACMYEYEDMGKFEEVFSNMRSKVHKQSWLDSIYNLKEKWAECYMRNVHSLGMRSTQLSESLNSDLKDYLNSELNIVRFFNHFERVVQGKRDKEIGSEYESRKKVPRVLIKTPMLLQAGTIYTPQIFEAFQKEYERSLAAYTKVSDAGGAYIVGITTLKQHSEREKEYLVVGDHSQGKVSCSCQQFERVGILCSHALKILDLMNIKQLPEHYILKRWTREARCGAVYDSLGRHVVENPNLDASRRYKFLSQRFSSLASRAVKSEECFVFMDNALLAVEKQMEEKFQRLNTSHSNVQSTLQMPQNHPSVTRLKKKESKKGGSKRKKMWHEKLHKRNREDSKEINFEGEKETGAAQSQPLTEKNWENPITVLQDDGFTGYTQLLTGDSGCQGISPEGTFQL